VPASLFSLLSRLGHCQEGAVRGRLLLFSGSHATGRQKDGI